MLLYPTNERFARFITTGAAGKAIVIEGDGPYDVPDNIGRLLLGVFPGSFSLNFAGDTSTLGETTALGEWVLG